MSKILYSRSVGKNDPFDPPVTDRRLVVLGGTGFIGSSVVRKALNMGYLVSVVARHRVSEKSLGWSRPPDWRIGSVSDRILLRDALQGADWVIDAVGYAPPSKSTAIHELDIPAPTYLTSLLELMPSGHGAGLTYLSSGGAVYGNLETQPVDERVPCRPISSYGALKLSAENAIRLTSRRNGTPVRILRIGNVYGPRQLTRQGQGLVEACFDADETGRALTLYGSGENIRDFVYISDVASAILGLSSDGTNIETLNIGTGAGFTTAKVISLIETITKRSIQVLKVPVRDVDVSNITLCVDRLRTTIHWDPVPFPDGVARAWCLRSQCPLSLSD